MLFLEIRDVESGDLVQIPKTLSFVQQHYHPVITVLPDSPIQELHQPMLFLPTTYAFFQHATRLSIPILKRPKQKSCINMSLCNPQEGQSSL